MLLQRPSGLDPEPTLLTALHMTRGHSYKRVLDFAFFFFSVYSQYSVPLLTGDLVEEILRVGPRACPSKCKEVDACAVERVDQDLGSAMHRTAHRKCGKQQGNLMPGYCTSPLQFNEYMYRHTCTRMVTVKDGCN